MTCGTPPSSPAAGLDHCPCKTFSPGEPSAHSTLPVRLSSAIKLGACGAVILTWLSSTPLDVQTNNTSPQAVTEQLAMLCWRTPNWPIISNCQMTSASSNSSLASSP